MKSHNGYVTLKSAPGEGSTFTLHFQAALADVDEPPVEHDVDLKGLRILVVGDDSQVQKSISSALLLAGAEVLATDDPDIADKLLDDAEFDVLVTDFIMDKMDGIELAKLVAQRQTDCDVVLISAYADMLEQSASIDAQYITHAIPKPVSTDRILRAVSQRKTRRGGRSGNSK